MKILEMKIKDQLLDYNDLILNIGKRYLGQGGVKDILIHNELHLDRLEEVLIFKFVSKDDFTMNFELSKNLLDGRSIEEQYNTLNTFFEESFKTFQRKHFEHKYPGGVVGIDLASGPDFSCTTPKKGDPNES